VRKRDSAIASGGQHPIIDLPLGRRPSYTSPACC
jgi:hypothetical protein